MKEDFNHEAANSTSWSVRTKRLLVMAQHPCLYCETGDGSIRESEIPQVEKFRLKVCEVFPEEQSNRHTALWTECMEGTWRDLVERGAERAEDEMMRAIHGIRKASPEKRNTTYLHGILMGLVTDAMMDAEIENFLKEQDKKPLAEEEAEAEIECGTFWDNDFPE